MVEVRVREEWLKCSASCMYFICTYCKIYDAPLGKWIPFVLWPRQREALDQLLNNRLNVILKSRQLGMTWLALCYILWNMLYRPAFTALVFSRRETEAIYLLGAQRLRGIYLHLPKWMRVRQVLTDASHEWVLSNGSVAYGFPTTAGDSYTAGYALVDEADLVPDLEYLMRAVKPTIDGGGAMGLISRADKGTPNSPFKKIYQGAKTGESSWKAGFFGWQARPDRDEAWYEELKRDIFARTGALDELYEQYPATDEEALRPLAFDRRLVYEMLAKCYQPLDPLPDPGIDMPLLKVYVPPSRLRTYVIGADPAEGNPTSDDSMASVVDVGNLEECAVLAGKIEPGVFASYLVALSTWYNNAGILPERNNHGHAVILAIDGFGMRDRLLKGLDSDVGWISSSRGKAVMYSMVADELREGRIVIHNADTFYQLVSIEGTTLRAPEGSPDDYAVGFSLAIVGAVAKPAVNFTYAYQRQWRPDARRSKLVVFRGALGS